MKKVLLLVMSACMMGTMLGGCYGPFQLTRKVYEWNGSLENPWGREAVFLLFNLVPVYGISLLGDGLIFNTIEFWGGENPISADGRKEIRMISAGEKQAVMSFSDKGRLLRVDIFNHYRPQDCFIIETPCEGCTVAKNASGEVVMSARTLLDGSVSVQDARGDEVARYPGNE